MNNASPLERKLQSSFEDPKAVLNAATKIDGRRFFKIFGRAGNLPNTEAEVDALRQHLVVENEIVAILPERQPGKHLAAESAVAGVILGQLDAEKQVLKSGEQAVRDVFVKRHASAQRGAANNAGAE